MPAGIIDNSLVVYAVADANEPDEFIYDTITLADISDGNGFTGYVSPNSYVVSFDSQGFYSPDLVDLKPVWFFDGKQLPLDPTQDPNFTWVKKPETNTLAGVIVNDKTGRVKLLSGDYFESNSSFSGTWEALYTYEGKEHPFQINETVYKVFGGQEVRLFNITSSSPFFLNRDSDTKLYPRSIEVKVNKTGINGDLEWEISNPNVNLYNAPLYYPDDLEVGELPPVGATLIGDRQLATTEEKVYIHQDEITSSITELQVTATVQDVGTLDIYEDSTNIVKLNEASGVITAIVSNPDVSVVEVYKDNGAGTLEAVLDFSESPTRLRAFQGIVPLEYSPNLDVTEGATPVPGKFKVVVEVADGGIVLDNGTSPLDSYDTFEVITENYPVELYPNDFAFANDPASNPEASIDAIVQTGAIEGFTDNLGAITLTFTGYTLDGTPFSVRKYQTYQKDQLGNDPEQFRIFPPSGFFIEAAGGSASPTSLEFIAQGINTNSSPTWDTTGGLPLYTDSSFNNLVTLQTAGDWTTGDQVRKVYVNPADLVGATNKKIIADIDQDTSAEATVYYLKEASASYTVTLSKTSALLPTDSNGDLISNVSFNGASTKVSIFKGSEDVTSEFKFWVDNSPEIGTRASGGFSATGVVSNINAPNGEEYTSPVFSILDLTGDSGFLDILPVAVDPVADEHPEELYNVIFSVVKNGAGSIPKSLELKTNINVIPLSGTLVPKTGFETFKFWVVNSGITNDLEFSLNGQTLTFTNDAASVTLGSFSLTVDRLNGEHTFTIPTGFNTIPGGTLEISVNEVGGSFSDEEIIGFTVDGISPALLDIENDQINLFADLNGSSIDYSTSNNLAIARVYWGGVIDTDNWDITFNSTDTNLVSNSTGYTVSDEGSPTVTGKEFSLIDVNPNTFVTTIIVTASPKINGARVGYDNLTAKITLVLRKLGDIIQSASILPNSKTFFRKSDGSFFPQSITTVITSTNTDGSAPSSVGWVGETPYNLATDPDVQVDVPNAGDYTIDLDPADFYDSGQSLPQTGQLSVS